LIPKINILYFLSFQLFITYILNIIFGNRRNQIYLKIQIPKKKKQIHHRFSLNKKIKNQGKNGEHPEVLHQCREFSKQCEPEGGESSAPIAVPKSLGQQCL
jgi:hypothetical protein